LFTGITTGLLESTSALLPSGLFPCDEPWLASLVAVSESIGVEGFVELAPVGPTELEPALLVVELEPGVSFDEPPLAVVVGGDIPVAPLFPVAPLVVEGTLDVPVTCGVVVVEPGIAVEEEGSVVVAGPLDDVEQAAVETNRPATKVTFRMVLCLSSAKLVPRSWTCDDFARGLNSAP
jgi:hypothetical protein